MQLETYFLNKIKNKPKSFWGKVLSYVLLGIFGVVVFIKYNYFKGQVESLKTKELLNEDDKKDKVLKEQLKELKHKKSDLIKEVVKSDSNINVIDGSITKTKKDTISDLNFVESLKDWDDVEKKIK